MPLMFALGGCTLEVGQHATPSAPTESEPGANPDPMAADGAECRTPSAYSVQELGKMGGTGTLDLNESGQVAGRSLDASWQSRAVVWTASGMALLESGDESTATGISSDGRVAGWQATTAGALARVWGPAGTRQLAPLPNDAASVAADVNASGLAVGWSINQTGDTTAVAWPALTAQRLTPEAGDAPSQSRAFAVNDRGQIVGRADFSSAPFQRALLWSPEGELTLPGLGGGGDSALAISPAGLATGASRHPGSLKFEAVLWRSGRVLELGLYQGAYATQGRAVNDCGAVVGEAMLDVSPEADVAGRTTAVIFREGTSIALNQLIPAESGWSLISAQAIDSRGRIAGYGVRRGQSSTRAFLLTPRD